MISLKRKNKIGILGLSFKMGTDDLRNSPIVEITEHLYGKGYEIKIFDDNVNLSKITGTNKEYLDKHIPHLTELIEPDLNRVFENSDILVITQNDKRFFNLTSRFKDKIIIDLVRIEDNYQAQNYDGICW